MVQYYDDLLKIRKTKPLVHHITNYVVMNVSANITLALGASPVMAHAKPEVEDMASIAQVLYLNIGTLSDEWIEAMIMAGKMANRSHVPVLLDPVGAGATIYRTQTANRILKEVKVNVLKGNGGEMQSLAGEDVKVKGVDSTTSASPDIASALASKYGLIAVVTGKDDYVSDGKKTAVISNGTDMFQKITGAGCMLGSIIASFMAINNDYFTASIQGLVSFEIAGEKAVTKSKLPGGFMPALIDAISILDEDAYKLAKVKIK
ncbi:MAG: hydroxyethylthiazole kinase [Deltaproteobacteria bacterium]|nr:hydroxyethylthiazole kinase [Deltaproteobacteria bacterium]MCL5792159.1 hydroxyethylthiazole kinase [Deltaproteobacteria bacterium]